MQMGKSLTQALFTLLLILLTATASTLVMGRADMSGMGPTDRMAKQPGNKFHLPGKDNSPTSLDKFTMTQAQQDRLFTIMYNQAPQRRMNLQKAQKSLQALQQLAKADRYDEKEARRLADDYGRALADLTLLGVELMSQFRMTLTESQRQLIEKAMQERKSHGDVGS
ncbi:MAG: hypothetical protein ABW092_19470 [Candidatus Thiodiazotropha sp.]